MQGRSIQSLMFDALISPVIINYRPKNRNTYIFINQEGEVHVRTPLRDEKKIRLILQKKEVWIRSKLTSIASVSTVHHTLGKTILFRGECIDIKHFPSLIAMINRAKSSIDIEKYYSKFYKNEAILTLPSRIYHYSKKMDLNAKEIRFKKMRRRWGSCSSDRIVTFNTKMMQLSYEHIDYIIVHELAHLVHMNHSQSFHTLVRTILPNEKKLRQELKLIRIH